MFFYNEPPDELIISGDQSPSVQEGTSSVGTYTANKSVTWGLSGVDSSLFQINSGGSLSFISAPDYDSPQDSGADNVYNINVEGDDGETTVQLSVAITVTEFVDLDAPNIQGSSSITMEQGLTEVATYTADESVTWSVSGVDSSLLQINAGGVLSFSSPPDYDSPQDSGANNVYDVNVVATDASTNSSSLGVSITIVDTIAPSITGSSTVSISEGSTNVGTYTSDESVTWSLSGVDASLMQINSSGTLSFSSAPDYSNPQDSGGNNVYDVTVIATDPATNSSSLGVAITVTELPVIVSSSLELYLDAANSSSYPGTGTTWYDLSPNSNDVTLTSGPTFSTGSGGTFYFDGINDYGVTANNIGFSGDVEATLSIWINMPSIAGGSWNDAISFGNPYVARAGMGIFVNSPAGGSGGVAAGFFTGQNPYATSVFSANNWYNVVFTKAAGAVNATNAKIYINGSQVTLNFSGISATAPNFTNTPLYLGKDTANQMYPGYIAQTMVYSKELTSAEVLQNYNATKSRFGL
jgi:serralysin